MKRFALNLAMVLVLLLLLVSNNSCKKDKPLVVDPPLTAAEVKNEINIALAAKDSLSVFSGRFKPVELSDDEVHNGLTLFAPVNKAFNNVGVIANKGGSVVIGPTPISEASIPVRLPDTSEMRDYLVKGKVGPDQLTAGAVLTSLSGKQLVVSVVQGKTFLNGVLISGKHISSGANYELHSLSGFIYQDKLPAITKLSDTKTFSGWLLTIEGRNFDVNPESNEVKLNGIKAIVNSASTTKLVVTVPAEATSGKLTVLTKGKTLSSAQDLVIMQAKVSTLNEILALHCTNIQGVAFDGNDNLYFTDNSNNRVIGYSSSGKIKIFRPDEQSSIDVNLDGIIDSHDRVYVFSSPWGIAADAQKNVYVSNIKSHNGIYKLDIADSTRSGWWAGNGKDAPHMSGQKMAVAVRAAALQFDRSGNLVLDNGPWLDRINNGSNMLSNLATAVAFKSADPMVLKDISINGIAIDSVGNIYLSDAANYRVWKIGTTGILTLAGNNNHVAKDGLGTSAQFGVPFGLTTDSRGNIYVCDNDYNTDTYLVRMINPLGMVSTIAGGKSAGDTDGVGKNARFTGVNAIARDSKGVLYIGTDNGRIRKLTIE